MDVDPSLANVLVSLDRVLDTALSLDLGAVTGQELADATVALRTLGARLAAFDARVVARFSSSGSWAEDGSRTVRSWMRERTCSGDGEIAARTTAATWITSYPHLAARLAAGEVSAEHLRVLATAHAQHKGLAAILTAAEPVIADFAVGRTPAELRVFLAELMLRAAPDLVDEAEGRKLKDRAGCDVTPLLDGWVRVVALLPPDLGAKFLACLRAAGLSQVRGQDTEGHADPSGSGEPGAKSGTGGSSVGPDHAAGERPPAQDPGLVCDRQPIRLRNLDAFARLLDHAEAGLGSGRLPNLRGSRPVVTVLVAQETLTAARRRRDVTPAQISGPACAGSTPVSGEAARRIACDAAIRRLVHDPTGHVLDVGRATRVISPALRAAIHFRDGGRCRWPGCRHPIDEIHHITHWAHGGATSRANTLGLCWWHHHLLHDDGWRLDGDAEHTVTFHNPRRPLAPPLTSRPPGIEQPQRASGASPACQQTASDAIF